LTFVLLKRACFAFDCGCRLLHAKIQPPISRNYHTSNCFDHFSFWLVSTQQVQNIACSYAMPKGIRKVYRQNGDSIKAPNSIQWLIVESCTTWPAVLAVCRIECVKLARSVCLICRWHYKDVFTSSRKVLKQLIVSRYRSFYRGVYCGVCGSVQAIAGCRRLHELPFCWSCNK